MFKSKLRFDTSISKYLSYHLSLNPPALVPGLNKATQHYHTWLPTNSPSQLWHLGSRKLLLSQTNMSFESTVLVVWFRIFATWLRFRLRTLEVPSYDRMNYNIDLTILILSTPTANVVDFLTTAPFHQYLLHPIQNEGPNHASTHPHPGNPGPRRHGLRRQPGRLRAQAHRVRQRRWKSKTATNNLPIWFHIILWPYHTF